jgi:chemotaxis protein histidine kinase CheA
MKKKLEAELISIAHRILKLKNKSDLIQLHQETQKLYEKLSVLRFVEENFADAKPTIGLSEIEEKIEIAFEAEPEVNVIAAEESIVTDKEETTAAVEPVVEEMAEVVSEEEAPQIEDEKEFEEETEKEEVATSEDEIEEEVVQEETSFKPAFELSFDAHDAKEEEVEIKEEAKPASSQITFDDLLGPDYVDPVFVKPEDLVNNVKAQDPNQVIPIGRSYNDDAPVISMKNDFGSSTISLNDRMAKGIIIGLNDRIAFMNHLFANSSEDYNRVLSQLMTFDTYGEAEDFIENMVKPDYNNWEGKDEYAQRFMEIVEKKFS